jgi:hypothetical protein
VEDAQKSIKNRRIIAMTNMTAVPLRMVLRRSSFLSVFSLVSSMLLLSSYSLSSEKHQDKRDNRKGDDDRSQPLDPCYCLLVAL